MNLIAYIAYSTATGAVVVANGGAAAMNASAVWTATGISHVRIGPPGPLTAANTPANDANSAWGLDVGNCFPIVTVVGAPALGVTYQLIRTNSTTWQIRTFAVASTGPVVIAASDLVSIVFAMYSVQALTT